MATETETFEIGDHVGIAYLLGRQSGYSYFGIVTRFTRTRKQMIIILVSDKWEKTYEDQMDTHSKVTVDWNTPTNETKRAYLQKNGDWKCGHHETVHKIANNDKTSFTHKSYGY